MLHSGFDPEKLLVLLILHDEDNGSTLSLTDIAQTCKQHRLCHAKNGMTFRTNMFRSLATACMALCALYRLVPVHEDSYDDLVLRDVVSVVFLLWEIFLNLLVI